MGAFKEPHGGELKELYLPEGKADDEKLRAKEYKSWDLTPRQLCDLELLMNGGFSPLDGFLGQADYDGVCKDMRLDSGVLWPMPDHAGRHRGLCRAARDRQDASRCATRKASCLPPWPSTDLWRPDLASRGEASLSARTTDTHPAVALLQSRSIRVYLGGRIHGIEPPTHYDFKLLRDTPRSCATGSASSAGAGSSPSRRATRCTARTRS